MTNYIYVIGTKGQETRVSERFEYEPSQDRWNNKGAQEAYAKAHAEARDMRAKGYRCRMYHTLTHMVEEDEE